MRVPGPLATLVVFALLVGVSPLAPFSAPPTGAPTVSNVTVGWAPRGHSAPEPIPMHPLAHPMAAGVGRLVVTTSDPLTFPNDGLRVNLTAFPPTQFEADSSFQVAVEETIGGYDAVFGLFENPIYPVVPFFSVFSNTTDQPLHLAYWTNLTLLSGTPYDFELQPGNGTVWQMRVNGQLFGSNLTDGQFDFGATQSTWIGGMSFSEIALYPSAPTAPPVMTASLTFAVHRPSGWYLPMSAITTITTPTGAAWGMAGRLQNPALAPGTTVSGTSVPIPGNGTDLWSGGPVAIGVSLTVPATAVSLTAVALSVHTTTAAGGALPGVAVAIRDQLRGNFIPAGLLTSTVGAASLAFQTPNVSASETDLVTVTVTTFGYVASTGVAIELTPAAQVVLVPDGGSDFLAPGGSLSVGWTTYSTNHSALAGVLVTFSCTSGFVTPVFAASDANGHLRTTLNGSLVRAEFVDVQAVVASQGAWGRSTVNVTIGAPPPPAWWEPYVEPGLVATMALVAAVVLFVWWRRRPRTPLPPMSLPKRRRLPMPASGPDEPTRRPPSAGGP